MALAEKRSLAETVNLRRMYKTPRHLAALTVALVGFCSAASAMDVYVYNKTPNCVKFDAYVCMMGPKMSEQAEIVLRPGESWKGVSNTWCASLTLHAINAGPMTRFGFDAQRDWKDGVAVMNWQYRENAPPSPTMVKVARSREKGGFRIDILELGDKVRYYSRAGCPEPAHRK